MYMNVILLTYYDYETLNTPLFVS